MYTKGVQQRFKNGEPLDTWSWHTDECRVKGEQRVKRQLIDVYHPENTLDSYDRVHASLRSISCTIYVSLNLILL